MNKMQGLSSQKDEILSITKDISVQLSFCMGLLENLAGFYENADLEGKQRILGSIFTGNLIYEQKKVRTTKVNEVVSLLINTNKAFRKNNNGQSLRNLRLPTRVTPTGLKPVTS